MNSVRYICGECGTEFDIPSSYLNKKVRCKCGKVDVATESEFFEEELAPLPPPTFSGAAPQYAPQAQYAPAPQYAPPQQGYGQARKKSGRSGGPLIAGNRSIIVIIVNALGTLFTLALGYGFINETREIIAISDTFLWSLISTSDKALIYLLMICFAVAILFYGIGQFMLLNRSRSGVVSLIIGHLILTGIYLYRGFNNRGMTVGVAMALSVGVFIVLILPLFFVREGLD